MTRRQRIQWRWILAYGIVVMLVAGVGIWMLNTFTHQSPLPDDQAPPVAIDSLHHIPVYYNGPVNHVGGFSVAKNGYKYGLQWQCVEFVKRYYAEHLGHYMPDADGNAKDFFDKSLPDASFNEARALVQYENPSLKKPQVDDIVVFDRSLGNKYGHIGIISAVYDNKVEIIQQNAGPDAETREFIDLQFADGRWELQHNRVLGWLRVE